MEIRAASADDLDWVRAELEAASLPTADLADAGTAEFLIASSPDGRTAGAVGIERFSDEGLLRSLIVEPGARRLGTGRELVRSLEHYARARGVRRLWLLTIDAEGYFERHGFDIVDREAVPDAIRGTTEFSSLCPGTAHVMLKRLD